MQMCCCWANTARSIHQLIQTVLNYVMFVLCSAAVHLEELHEVIKLAMDVTTCRKDADTQQPSSKSCTRQAAAASVSLLLVLRLHETVMNYAAVVCQGTSCASCLLPCKLGTETSSTGRSLAVQRCCELLFAANVPAALQVGGPCRLSMD
jgi:hypothetical protein